MEEGDVGGRWRREMEGEDGGGRCRGKMEEGGRYIQRYSTATKFKDYQKIGVKESISYLLKIQRKAQLKCTNISSV